MARGGGGEEFSSRKKNISNFLKVVASIFWKPDEKDSTNQKGGRRKRYPEGYGAEFLYTSVKKAIILGIFPDLPESYHNLKYLLDLLKLPSVDFTFSQDIKVMLQIVGKQCAASKHPCPFCPSSTPALIKEKEYTLGELLEWNQKYVEAGSILKSAKEFSNCVQKPLITGNSGDCLIDKLNIPELHIILGVVDKILSEIEKKLFPSKEFGFTVLTKFLESINLRRVSYHGQHKLEGNHCSKLLKNSEKLSEFLKAEVEEEKKPLLDMFMNTLNSFNQVVKACFGKDLEVDYVSKISDFSSQYRSLGISTTVKVHILEAHVETFLRSKGNIHGLGHWTEQALEAVHADFKKTWAIRKVPAKHPDFAKFLKNVVCAYNIRHF